LACLGRNIKLRIKEKVEQSESERVHTTAEDASDIWGRLSLGPSAGQEFSSDPL